LRVAETMRTGLWREQRAKVVGRSQNGSVRARHNKTRFCIYYICAVRQECAAANFENQVKLDSTNSLGLVR
jgi:hypothetical protein